MWKVEDDGQRVRAPERIPMSSSRPVQSDPNSLCISKVGILAFIAMVINCTAQMERRSQKIDLVAAETFLGVRDFSAEDLQGVLREEIPSSRADSLV